MQGAVPPSSSELFRSSDRLSFVYVEHATISRADSAVTFVKEEGVVHCPAASLSALLLGPGDGFVGGVRYYGGVGWRAGCSLLCER